MRCVTEFFTVSECALLCCSISNLVRKSQFATIDAPFLGWDFDLRDEQNQLIGNVNRNFVGFAREVRTYF